MKKLLFLLIIFCFSNLICFSQNKDPELKAKVLTNKKSSNPYLEVDFTSQQLSFKSANSEDKKHATQVVYSAFKRAYEHIEVENGLYKLNISDCKEINISPEIFKMIKGMIKEGNDKIKELKKQGYDYPAVENTKVMDIQYWQWEKVLEMYAMYNKTE